MLLIASTDEVWGKRNFLLVERNGEADGPRVLEYCVCVVDWVYYNHSKATTWGWVMES